MYQGDGHWEDWEILGDRFWEKFVSDGSNQRWGYKFTVIPEYPPLVPAQTAGASERYVELCLPQLDGEAVVGFSSEPVIAQTFKGTEDPKSPLSPAQAAREETFTKVNCLSCSRNDWRALTNAPGGLGDRECSVCGELATEECAGFFVSNESSCPGAALCNDCLWDGKPPSQEWLDAQP